MIKYTIEQVAAVKTLRLAYISKEICVDTYELEIAKLNAAATSHAKKAA